METMSVYGSWDEEAGVWVASSDDLPGLATEADTLDHLVEKLKLMIPELLEANKFLNSNEIPFALHIGLTAVAGRLAVEPGRG